MQFENYLMEVKATKRLNSNVLQENLPICKARVQRKFNFAKYLVNINKKEMFMKRMSNWKRALSSASYPNRMRMSQIARM